MVTAIALTFLAVVCRLCSAHFEVWNFVPMGAVALYAGARLPRRWAWIVPVAAMGLSDLLLDYGTNRTFSTPSRWFGYVIFAYTDPLGPAANRPRIGPLVLPILALTRIDVVLPGEQLRRVDRGTPLPADAVRTDRLLCQSDSLLRQDDLG